MCTLELSSLELELNYNLTSLSSIDTIDLSGGVDKPLQALCGVLLFCVGLGASITPAGAPIMITAATMVVDSI
jgi:hypothetical protein